ncbi:MAG: glycosyltransferase [Chitinophagaceae bacterium]|nr:glycosyltransferase [Chitinophagaceae bacterium]
MPSIVEGTPFAMIESMACGKPAVGTPVGGIPELIIENETGWLARTTAVEDIDVALEVAWNERAKWFDFGANAQKLIEKIITKKFVCAINQVSGEDLGIV